MSAQPLAKPEIKQLDEGEPDPSYIASKQCPRCSSGRMQRAHRATYFDWLVSWAGFFPAICSECYGRGRILLPSRLLACLAATSLLLGCMALIVIKRPHYIRGRDKAFVPPVERNFPIAPAPIAAEAAFSPGDKLTNRDVVAAIKKGAPTEAVLKRVGKLGQSFQVDPKSMEQLRDAGVPEEVILAMADSTVATEVSAALSNQTMVPATLGYRPDRRTDQRTDRRTDQQTAGETQRR